MKIVICIKQVMDSAVPLEIDLAANAARWREVDSYALNPLDRRVVDRAVSITKGDAESTITALSIGPPRVDRTLRECLALGVNDAIRIWDPVLEDADTFATALVLSKVIGVQEPDLVLCGAASSDWATGGVGQSLATMLGLPYVSYVADFEMCGDGEGLIAQRQLARGGREEVHCPIPCLLTLNVIEDSTGYPGLPRWMRALRSSIKALSLVELGLPDIASAEQISKTKLLAVLPPRQRPKKIFTPDSNLPPAERLRQLMSGGVGSKKTNLHEGNASDLASKVVEFARQQKILGDSV